MSSDLEEWVVHVQIKGKDFIRSALTPNKPTTISGSFDADIVLRKLQENETKIQFKWVKQASETTDSTDKTNTKSEQKTDHQTPEPQQAPSLIPFVQIASQSTSLQVNDADYVKPFVIKNDLAKISLPDLTILISTQSAFDAYQAGAEAQSTKENEHDSLPAHEDDADETNTESSKPRAAKKAKAKKGCKLRFQVPPAIINTIKNTHTAVIASFAALSVITLSTASYFTYDYFAKENRKDRMRLNRLSIASNESAQKKIKQERHADVVNDFNAIMSYYPNLHLELDYRPEKNSAIISGYTSDPGEAERFARSLQDDLGIGIEFQIKSLDGLSKEINTKLSETTIGEVSLVYPEKGKLTCITSAYEQAQYAEIEEQIRSISRATGYPEDIKCVKVLFSKDEISFVSNAEYPFVKLKNGSIYFKDSEVSQGVFLVDINEERLVFMFQNTKFYLTLR